MNSSKFVMLIDNADWLVKLGAGIVKIHDIV